MDVVHGRSNLPSSFSCSPFISWRITFAALFLCRLFLLYDWSVVYYAMSWAQCCVQLVNSRWWERSPSPLWRRRSESRCSTWLTSTSGSRRGSSCAPVPSRSVYLPLIHLYLSLYYNHFIVIHHFPSTQEIPYIAHYLLYYSTVDSQLTRSSTTRLRLSWGKNWKVKNLLLQQINPFILITSTQYMLFLRVAHSPTSSLYA